MRLKGRRRGLNPSLGPASLVAREASDWVAVDAAAAQACCSKILPMQPIRRFAAASCALRPLALARIIALSRLEPLQCVSLAFAQGMLMFLSSCSTEPGLVGQQKLPPIKLSKRPLAVIAVAAARNGQVLVAPKAKAAPEFTTLRIDKLASLQHKFQLRRRGSCRRWGCCCRGRRGTN